MCLFISIGRNIDVLGVSPVRQNLPKPRNIAPAISQTGPSRGRSRAVASGEFLGGTHGTTAANRMRFRPDSGQENPPNARYDGKKPVDPVPASASRSR